MNVYRVLRIGLTPALVIGLVLSAYGIASAAIDCFSCHDRNAFLKKVNHVPVAEGKCLSCHNPHVAKFEGLLQEKVKDLCYSCHTDTTAKVREKGLIHNPVRKGECLGCHNPHSSNQANLLNKKLSETCFSCHDKLPRNFKNTHEPYAKGQCGSCHKPHQSDYPNLLKKSSESLCLGCHAASEVRSSHPGFPEEPKNCGSCHNPHGSDRPSLIRNVLHEPYSEGCGDCHSGKGQPVRIDTCLDCHPEVSEQMASSHNHLVRYEENGCVACHTPHAGDDKRMLKGKERHICGACHKATFEKQEVAKSSHSMTDACNNCHAPHGSNHPTMLKAPVNDVCSECHGQHGIFTHPIGEKVFDPRTGQMMTCISCHATKGSEFDYHTRLDRKKALCVQCHSSY